MCLYWCDKIKYIIYERKNVSMKDKKQIICPICGGIMEEYIYDYNTNPEERTDYKCSECGHKETKLNY